MIKEKTTFFSTLGFSLLQINVDSTVATQANPQMLTRVLLYNFVEKQRQKLPNRPVEQYRSKRRDKQHISFLIIKSNYMHYFLDLF
jgi:hypothetical protein